MQVYVPRALIVSICMVWLCCKQAPNNILGKPAHILSWCSFMPFAVDNFC